MEKARWMFNIKLWEPTKEEIALAFSLIQSEERSRIMEFVYQKDTRGSLIGRLMIRKYVTRIVKRPWSEIKLVRSEHGKPMIASPKAAEALNFNVSHHGAYTGFASSGLLPIGLDIMTVDSDIRTNIIQFFRLMRRQMNEKEWAFIEGHDTNEEKLKMFTRFWCLKESYVKALGIGITVDLCEICFKIMSPLCDGTAIRCSTVAVRNLPLKNWVFEETLIKGHIFTVGINNSLSTRIQNVPIKFIDFKELTGDLSSSEMNKLNTKGFYDLAEKFLSKPYCKP